MLLMFKRSPSARASLTCSRAPPVDVLLETVAGTVQGTGRDHLPAVRTLAG